MPIERPDTIANRVIALFDNGTAASNALKGEVVGKATLKDVYERQEPPALTTASPGGFVEVKPPTIKSAATVPGRLNLMFDNCEVSTNG